jgi:hypothetical protein
MIRKNKVNLVFVLIFVLTFLGCDGIVVLFHGPRPEEDFVTVVYTTIWRGFPAWLALAYTLRF